MRSWGQSEYTRKNQRCKSSARERARRAYYQERVTEGENHEKFPKGRQREAKGNSSDHKEAIGHAKREGGEGPYNLTGKK